VASRVGFLRSGLILGVCVCVCVYVCEFTGIQECGRPMPPAHYLFIFKYCINILYFFQMGFVFVYDWDPFDQYLIRYNGIDRIRKAVSSPYCSTHHT